MATARSAKGGSVVTRQQRDPASLALPGFTRLGPWEPPKYDSGGSRAAESGIFQRRGRLARPVSGPVMQHPSHVCVPTPRRLSRIRSVCTTFSCEEAVSEQAALVGCCVQSPARDPGGSARLPRQVDGVFVAGAWLTTAQRRSQ